MGIKAIIRTLPYVINSQTKTEIYQRYMATAVGGLAGMSRSYSDLIDFKKQDNRNPEEIKNDIVKRAGLVVIK